MAGLGRKVFAAGEVLTAANVGGYLMDQTVMVFDDAASRTSALGLDVAEGMVAYTKDDNAIQYYSGSAWVSVSSPGDITEVIAGTALTGGGDAGAVTLNVDLDAVNTTTFITDATTARTLTATDAGNTILFTSATAVTVTVDASTDFPVGTRVDIVANGAGALTVTASVATVTGAATSTTSGSFTIGAQYSAATLLCVATDTYLLIGNVAVV
tara:strand:- start:2725 stop:3360 length:636 start_codon:yes stop_codon:yes gene_type:complete